MLKVRAGILRIGLVVLLAACGDDSIAGTYALISVEGIPLPHTTLGNLIRIDVVAGTLVLNGDGTFAEQEERVTTNLSSGNQTPSTLGVSGTYSVEGKTLTLRADPGAVRIGTADGRTVDVNGWLFRR